MFRDAPCNVDFFEWLDTLTDEEHSQVLEELRKVAGELGVRADSHLPVTQHLLNFLPHVPPKFSLN